MNTEQMHDSDKGAKRARRSPGRIARDIALFLAGPFVAVAYIIALPFVTFFMFVKLAHEAYQKRHAAR